MKNIFETAAEMLESGLSFAFAVIVSQDGSAPRGKGTKMLVTEERIYETIGGGGMEAQVIRGAREEVLKAGKAVLQYYDLSAAEAAAGDFICGGCCEILILHITPEDKNNTEIFRAAAEAYAGSIPAWFIYVFDTNTQQFSICLNIAEKQLIGSFQGDEKIQRDMLESPLRIAVHGDTDDAVRYYADAVHTSGNMLLFGGGHVSLETAALAVRLGFRVTVIDDREEYANESRFPGCRCEVVSSFDSLPEFETDMNTYILIITRGHAHDRTVLEWALSRDVFYTGMIGSRNKRDTIYAKLEEKGISREKTAQVKCPVGLPIGAQTPAEIAVSIMAQIIEEKSRKA